MSTIPSPLDDNASAHGRELEMATNDNTGELRSLIEKIEKLELEEDYIRNDIYNLYVESRENGYDPVLVRKLIHARRQRPNGFSFESEKELQELYSEFELRENFKF